MKAHDPLPEMDDHDWTPAPPAIPMTGSEGALAAHAASNSVSNVESQLNTMKDRLKSLHSNYEEELKKLQEERQEEEKERAKQEAHRQNLEKLQDQLSKLNTLQAAKQESAKKEGQYLADKGRKRAKVKSREAERADSEDSGARAPPQRLKHISAKQEKVQRLQQEARDQVEQLQVSIRFSLARGGTVGRCTWRVVGGCRGLWAVR